MGNCNQPVYSYSHLHLLHVRTFLSLSLSLPLSLFLVAPFPHFSRKGEKKRKPYLPKTAPPDIAFSH